MANKLNIFKALADKTRLKIVTMLIRREMCVCQIQRELCMSQPRISRHLSILKKAGLLESKREGKMIFFFILKTKENKKMLEFLKESK
ncbi:MAG: metalloregulator ArsR/SmtB family transcription factor [bacterium]|nr:metalloregulator ArsR/SmtB family transcription factor [bacterium]